MKRKEAFALIADPLKAIFLPAGFKFVRSKEGFVRLTEVGNQLFGVSVMERSYGFELGFGIGIRIDAAEDIIHMFSGTPPGYQSDSFTSQCVVKNLFSPSTFVFATEGEAAEASESLVPTITQKVIPFLDSHKDAESIYDLLVNKEGQFDQTPPSWRNSHAIIVAYLARKPNFPELVSKYRKSLNEADDSKNSIWLAVKLPYETMGIVSSAGLPLR